MLPNKKTLVVDLDNTICFSNTDPEARKRNDTYELYYDPEPNLPLIYKLRLAKKQGYTIVISTSRRMMTHAGDLHKIRADVEAYTTAWLDRYDVPYDELIFGKPFGVYYIDDKSLRPDEFLGVNL